MGRHSASYIAAQQSLSTRTTTAGAARHVGRVGGLALALGIGAAVAGGAGVAHADGTPDSGSKVDKSSPSDTDSTTNSTPRKPGLFGLSKAASGTTGGTLTGRAADPGALPGLISKIPKKIAGLVEDRATAVTGATTSPTGGRTEPQTASKKSPRRGAVTTEPGPTTGGGGVDKAAQFQNRVDQVVTDLKARFESPAVAPSTPDPTPQPPRNISPFTTVKTEPATTFAAPMLSATAQSRPTVTTVLAGLLAPLNGISSGSGGSPVAPGPVITGALQLLRRDTTTPSFDAATVITSISAILHPGPAPEIVDHRVPGEKSTTTDSPSDDDAPVHVTGVGNVGKYMLESDGSVSDYGGQQYEGKTLIEPVNVIIVDPNSKSEAESALKVNKAMAFGGFPSQPIHSSGFMGEIGGEVYGQQGLPLNAYSDNLFIFQNNHGRLFGAAPAENGQGYVYTGAFSEESAPIIYNGLPTHGYVSSNVARDVLVARMIASGQVSKVEYVPLNNAYNGNDASTGDHDGYAAVITLK